MSDLIIPINLAVEDSLSEAVARAILKQSGRPFEVGISYSKGGFGYLKNRVQAFNNAARTGTPFLILTDLDQTECPLALLQEWLPDSKHPNLIFRIAVKEVEAWLLAHREAFARYIGVNKELIPPNVELINDPKQFLIDLVKKKSRKRELKQAIVPPEGSIRQQGPNYNGQLIEFVQNFWDAAIASENSPSLHKAVNAVSKFQWIY